MTEHELQLWAIVGGTIYKLGMLLILLVILTKVSRKP